MVNENKSEVVYLATVGKYRDKDAKANIVNQLINIISMLKISMTHDIVLEATKNAARQTVNVKLEQEVKDAKQRIADLDAAYANLKMRDVQISALSEELFDTLLKPKIKELIEELKDDEDENVHGNNCCC